jgi:hypothetical protein
MGGRRRRRRPPTRAPPKAAASHDFYLFYGSLARRHFTFRCLVPEKALRLSERFRSLRRRIGMLQRLVVLLERLEAFPEIPDAADSRKVEQIFAQPLVSRDSWGRGLSFAGAGKSL